MSIINIIFADFNNTDMKGRLRSSTKGTLRDLKDKNIVLKNGLEVLIDDHDGLITPGVVGFSEEENIWVAIIVWELLK